MSKIYYVGNYIDKNNEINYEGNLPGRLKMRYVIDCIKKNQNDIEVFSLCSYRGKKFFSLRKSEIVDEKEKIRYVSSFRNNTKFLRFINRILVRIQFFLFLISLQKNSILINYHSFSTSKTLSKIKKIKKLKIIMEVEEIYGYSALGRLSFVNKEISILKKFDNYIVVNDEIINTLDLENKNFHILYGAYYIPEVLVNRSDDKIKVIYAGTIETRKKGAITAVESAKFLPDNYLLYIVGFGKEKAIDLLKNKIDCINQKNSNQKIKYLGFLEGEELSELLLSCHIGLSTYIMEEGFSNNSLPSKITTYMCHNLFVVTGYSKNYEKMAIAEKWSFYKKYEPETIANAIVSVDISKENSSLNLIKKLDREFKDWLKKNL